MSQQHSAFLESFLQEASDAASAGADDAAPAAPADAGAGAGALELDFDATPAQVLQRIEDCALWALGQLKAGLLPDLEVAAPAAGAPPRVASLAGRRAGGADAYARLWSVLAVCHELVATGAAATQREAYYRLKTSPSVRSPRDVDAAVQDAVRLLRVPRAALGLGASAKGLVAGALRLADARGGGAVADCAAARGGLPIPGDLSAGPPGFLPTAARFVLVVEKDAVFQRLAADRLWERLPCVLVTGKGFPDLGTRAFVAALAAAFPALPLLALVDWNPAGAAVLALYARGSARMAESAAHALPRLRWLGARAAWLAAAAPGAFQALTPRDRALARGLAAGLGAARPGWAAELALMQAAGHKAEMEAVYTACGGAAGFAGVLLRAAAAGDAV